MKTSFSKIIMASLVSLLCVTASHAGLPAGDKDSAKLVTAGKSLLNQGQIEEALTSFRQAAKAGNMEGAYLAGDTLLNQAKNCYGRERILKGSESLGYLFVAATNLYPQACAGLSDALLNGIGTRTNAAAAYAWMKLAAQRDSSLKANLDQLAVQLNPADVRRGQELAREYQSAQWPSGLTRPVDENDPRLKIQGVTISNTRPFVVMNSTTFAAGDTGDVRPVNSPKRPNAERLSVRCLEIGEDYVLVAVAGENRLKLLSTDQFSSR